jgi:GxxExxY protein
LTHKVIAAAIEVHKNLGPGLLEAVYRLCLELEFESCGLKYQKEVPIPLVYKDKKIDHCFRLDFLVENELIIELKSIETMLPVHEAQLLTYMRLSGKQVGLLINFNVPILKMGIRRCILNKQECSRVSALNVSDFISTEERHETLRR